MADLTCALATGVPITQPLRCAPEIDMGALFPPSLPNNFPPIILKGLHTLPIGLSIRDSSPVSMKFLSF